MNNKECFFKETWVDYKNKTVTFCYARGCTIPSSLCKTCERFQPLKAEQNKNIKEF